VGNRNEQRTTNNEQRTTNNEQRTTNNEQRTTNNEQGKPMKAILIDPVAKHIDWIECANEASQWAARIGAKAVEFDDVKGTSDRLCFDEDCFIAAKPGRFQLDTLAPVAGAALIVGAEQANGTAGEPSIALDALRERIRFL
jgi:hypothetical protein